MHLHPLSPTATPGYAYVLRFKLYAGVDHGFTKKETRINCVKKIVNSGAPILVVPVVQLHHQY